MSAQIDRPRLGHLPPRHRFFLNPYRDARFTTFCPGCGGKPRQRKLPLAIHVDDWGMVIMNKTCRYCPACDLLIAHEDELRSLLDQLLSRMTPAAVGRQFLVVGTLQRGPWRRGLAMPLAPDEMLAALHDFRRYDCYQPLPCWRRDESTLRAKPR